MALLIGEPIRTVAPSAPAVEVWEVAEQARIDVHDEDALIERQIAAATEVAENYTGLGLITQVWKLSIDAFSSTVLPLVLPRRPLQGVVSIDYLDADGDGQSLDPSSLSGFRISGIGAERTFGWIAPANGGSWPSGTDVEISFAVGFGDSSLEVPQAIRHAIILMVAASFDQRNDAPIAELPLASQNMLRYWRRPALA